MKSSNKIIQIFVFFHLLMISNGVYGQNQVLFLDTIKEAIYNEADLDSVFRKFKKTGINIKLPKHFTEFESDKSSGFMNKGASASIIAYQYDDIPYVGFYDAIAEKAFINVDENTEYVGSEILKTKSGKPADFYFYTFSIKDVKINRIIFFTGNEKQMVFLQANYPSIFDPLIRQAIMRSFLTVEFE